MSNQSELISAISHTFTYMDIEKMSEGLGLIFESLPSDNLSQWSKENGQFQYTSQALCFNALANGLDYAVKNQQKLASKTADDLNQHNKTNNGTEFWNVKAESLLERLAIIEHNLDALEQVFHAVKEKYERQLIKDNATINLIDVSVNEIFKELANKLKENSKLKSQG